MGAELRVGNWTVMLDGPKTLRLVRHDGIEVILPHKVSIRNLRIGQLMDYVAELDELIEKGSMTAKKGTTKFKLKRKTKKPGIWFLMARGGVNYDIELATSEALLIALKLQESSIEDITLKEFEWRTPVMFRGIREALLGVFSASALSEVAIAQVFKDRLDRAYIRHGAARAELLVEDKHFYIVLEGAGKGELGLFKKLADALRLDKLPVSDSLAARLLLGSARVPDILEDKAGVLVRKRILKELFKEHKGEMKFKGKHLVVGNKYGTWRINLKTGELRLNEYLLCIMPAYPFKFRGYIRLPRLGTFKLDSRTARVLAVAHIALRPDEVKDKSIKEQIRTARKRLVIGDFFII